MGGLDCQVAWRGSKWWSEAFPEVCGYDGWALRRPVLRRRITVVRMCPRMTFDGGALGKLWKSAVCTISPECKVSRVPFTYGGLRTVFTLCPLLHKACTSVALPQAPLLEAAPSTRAKLHILKGCFSGWMRLRSLSLAIRYIAGRAWLDLVASRKGTRMHSHDLVSKRHEKRS